MTGWIAVQRSTRINYDLENSPLQIRTDTSIGSDDYVHVHFFSASGIPSGEVMISFRSPPKYWLEFCTPEPINFPTALPTETNKIWTITLNRISGIRLIIHCNNKEVLNFVISSTTCSDNNWSRDMGKIEFGFYDTASDFYRTGK